MEHARNYREYRSGRERCAYEILQQDRTTQDEMRCEQNCLIHSLRRCQMLLITGLHIFTNDFLQGRNLGSFPSISTNFLVSLCSLDPSANRRLIVAVSMVTAFWHQLRPARRGRSSVRNLLAIRTSLDVRRTGFLCSKTCDNQFFSSRHSYVDGPCQGNLFGRWERWKIRRKQMKTRNFLW